MERKRQKTSTLLRTALQVSVVLIFVFLLFPADADQIEIATWNIKQLRDSNSEGSNSRNQVDYDRLAQYANLLNATVIVWLIIVVGALGALTGLIQLGKSNYNRVATVAVGCLVSNNIGNSLIRSFLFFVYG